MVDMNSYIALHKFGLGARQGEAQQVGSDPQAWLLAQLTDVSSTLDNYSLVSSQEGITLFYEYLNARRLENNSEQPISVASVNKKDRLAAFVADIDRIKSTELMLDDNGVRGSSLAEARNIFLDKKTKGSSTIAANKPSHTMLQQMYSNHYDEIGVRTTHAVMTPASFREALVRFWSDHFNVFSGKSLLGLVTSATMEREAIRPHVTGKFIDMLVAVESHPAMLVYLDNWISVGPNSFVGQEFGLGLNENLARETLELHTLGVDGGYTQDDIISYAKAITGWSFGNPNIQSQNMGAFIFEPLLHEPGPVTVMNKTYTGTGQDQGLEVLADLASHPSTAKFIAGKLARHFHSDNPPQSLIDRLEQAFTASQGDLLVVSSALVSAPEMWLGDFSKLRNSEEFVIAALRAFGFDTLTPSQSVFVFDAVTQIPFSYHAPDGWPKEEASWASSSILSARINLCNLLSGYVPNSIEPLAAAQELFGPILSQFTADAISAASSVEQGYTLLMTSPEFQRT